MKRGLHRADISRYFCPTKSKEEAPHVSKARAMITAHFLSEGISPYMASKILDEKTMALLRQLPDHPVRKRLEDSVPLGVEMLAEKIRSFVAGRPVCLVSDEASKRYGLSRGAVVVIASTVGSRPVLLRCECNPKHFDSQRIVEQVAEDYDILRENIVGLSADHARTMSSVANKLGLRHFGCLCHSLYLLPDASKLFRYIKQFFTVGVSNRSVLLREHGLSLESLRSVSMRWGSFWKNSPQRACKYAAGYTCSFRSNLLH